jgi:hypothetical protein
MKKVKLKSYLELKKLIKAGKVEMIRCSDDGQFMTLGVLDGGLTHIFGVNYEDFGSYYEVTKLDNHISQDQLKRLEVLFE